MEKIKRSDIGQKYFRLELFEYATGIIPIVTMLGKENVTIENFMHYGRTRGTVNLTIQEKGNLLTPLLKRYDVDFSINKNEFLQLTDIWNEQGCFAIFHSSSELKFKTNDLPEQKRYAALDNFDWNIEMIIPGPASTGIVQITSNDKSIIDTLEIQFENFFKEN